MLRLFSSLIITLSVVQMATLLSVTSQPGSLKGFQFQGKIEGIITGPEENADPMPADEPSKVIPEGYELFPGVGYYKFHAEDTFNDAKLACESEGAWLAIPSSDRETEVLVTIYARHQNESGNGIFLGFDDQKEENIFVEVVGPLLSDLGYSRWAPGEPNDADNEDCGAMYGNGDWNDVSCDLPLPYICEIQL